jgi:hypothetical protein
MDYILSNIGQLINNNFPPTVHNSFNNIKNLTALSVLLRYEKERDKALNLLSRLFLSMGHYGEAYRAATYLAPGLYPDATAIRNHIESIPCQNLT